MFAIRWIVLVSILVLHTSFIFTNHKFSKLERRSSAYDDDPMDFVDVAESLQYFREYAKRGLDKFRSGRLDDAIIDLKRAVSYNNSQPLPQLGIFLYCANEYEAAYEQLCQDIEKLEDSKLFKATELRLFASASQNKLNNRPAAVAVLDHLLSPTGLTERRKIMKNILGYYAQENTLEHMLEVIGTANDKDFEGTIFYGNFFMGLYHDSVGDEGLSQMFLNFVKESTRYPPADMWYHLPRVFYSTRFGTGDEAGTTGAINSRGFIL